MKFRILVSVMILLFSLGVSAATKQKLILLTVTFGDTPEQVKTMCQLKHKEFKKYSEMLGCAFKHPSGTCQIITLRPKTWEDELALATAGHELMHCLGEKHD